MVRSGIFNRQHGSAVTQTYWRQLYGRRARTKRRFSRGPSCSARESSHSDTLSEKTWVLFMNHLMDIWLNYKAKSIVHHWLPAHHHRSVQGSQTCDLHEGPERSFPAREDGPRSRPADLLPAGGTHQEFVCLPWEWTGEDLSTYVP